MKNIFRNISTVFQNIEIVVSPRNLQVKKLKKIIASNKFRQTEKLFWLEGEKLCSSYFKNFNRKNNIIFVFNENLNILFLENIIKKNNLNDVKFLRLATKLFNEISQVENSPGWGIVGNYPEDPFLVKKKLNDLVILDGIQDPGNLGNIIRTTAAVGVENIWLTKGTADPFSPKVIRAGCGGQFLLNFTFFLNLDEILKRQEILNMQLFATVLHGSSINLFDKNLSLKKKCAWIFGAEGTGLSKAIVKKYKLLCLNIPHINEIESLNVATAVAICLFEMERQRSN